MENYYYITPEEYEIAEKNGINKRVVYQRVFLGWSKKRAITVPLQIKKLTNEHFEIAKKNGISKNTVKHRVSHLGWDIEKAITRKAEKRKNKYLDLAKANGIKESTYFSRIYKGWSKKDAATIKPLTRKESIKKALDAKHGRDIKVS